MKSSVALQILRNRGLWPTLRAAPRFLSGQVLKFLRGSVVHREQLNRLNAEFDAIHGTDTFRDEMFVTNDVATEHIPLPAFFANRLLSDLRPLAQGSTFVDIGSGRGQMVLLATQERFSRVVGVEFVEESHRGAVVSLERWPPSMRQCAEVDLVHQDARQFAESLPPGNLILYLFHPFEETATLASFLGRVVKNDMTDRTIRVVYVGSMISPCHPSTKAYVDVIRQHGFRLEGARMYGLDEPVVEADLVKGFSRAWRMESRSRLERFLRERYASSWPGTQEAGRRPEKWSTRESLAFLNFVIFRSSFWSDVVTGEESVLSDDDALEGSVRALGQHFSHPSDRPSLNRSLLEVALRPRLRLHVMTPVFSFSLSGTPNHDATSEPARP